jgi:3'(2'), 5'-bisphosphate nucleotidase
MLKELKTLTLQASQIILKHYEKESIPSQTKRDHSPVTEADLEANELIQVTLQKLSPGVPIISEESPIPSFDVRKNWSEFWLVDPLDGTKEFLKKNGEFTVNIALIQNGEPTIGVLGIPAQNLLFSAKKGCGTWKETFKGKPERVFSCRTQVGNPVTLVTSRSHVRDDFEELIASRFQIKERIHIGSSLKFTYLAEGKANLYPRRSPCMEWDIAAGDCLYRNSVADQTPLLFSPFQYNKPSLENASFILGLSEEEQLDLL